MHHPQDIELVVFDMNAIAYACAYQPNLANLRFGDQPTGVIHGTIASFLGAIQRYPQAIPIALWDGHAAWRQSYCPGYKSSRADSPEKVEVKERVKLQTPIVQTLLHDLGVAQARHPHAEADDLAGCIARVATLQGIPTRMITVDTDWWQAISEWVEWEHAREDTVLAADNFSLFVNKKTPPDGWASPREYLEAKVIAGDSSDDIPGIQGAGLATAAKMLRAAGGLQGILTGQLQAKGVVADRLRSEGAHALLRANLAIIDWDQAPIHDPNSLALWCYPENPSATRETAQAFGLKRMAERARPGLVRSPLAAPAQGIRAWGAVVRALNWPLQAAAGQMDEASAEEAA